MLRISIILFFSISLISNTVHAQIVINEVVSSNIVHKDEDGDTPDWIELKNFGTSEVDLSGWTLSDNADQLDKWTIESSQIPADGFITIWASGKNKSQQGIPRTIIDHGDSYQYLTPNQPINPNWLNIYYNDANWLTGNSGFGYADGDDATQLENGTLSVFMRRTFEISDASLISDLFLDIDYDDGFVAYLNGEEVARANITGNPPSFNTTSPMDHEAVLYLVERPEQFHINNLLQDGTNVLCIQAHNVSNTSSDMTIIPFLTGIYSEETFEGVEPPAILEYGSLTAHTNFKISSDGETIYLYDNAGIYVDSIQTGFQIPGSSTGLNIEGTEQVYFNETTFNAENSSESFLGILKPNIQFSHPGGPSGNLSLTLSGNLIDQDIRFTQDFLIPSEFSTLYDSPILINSKTTIRASIFKDGYISSPVQSRAYLLGENSDLPMLNIITEPDNFFDSDIGIYVLGDDYQGDYPYFGSNIWEDWERPIEFSLFNKNGGFEYHSSAGVKIFGGYSRGLDQRSLSFFARSTYGNKSFDYPLLDDSSTSEYQSIIIRNAGNDNNRSHLRDRVLTSLMKDSGVDFQEARPLVAYINGEYWGIYNMREKVNEHFLHTNHQIDVDQIDILEFDGQLIHGDNMDYQLMIQFVEENDLSIDANFEVVSDQVNLQNFASYFAAEIYYNNTDWPGNNIKFWRAKNGKWRWILFDTDFGFGTWNPFDYSNNTINFAIEDNGPAWPNPPWSTLLFRKLLENTSFRNLSIKGILIFYS